MDFFHRQDEARAKTTWLLFLFILGIVSTAFLIHLLVAFIISSLQEISYSFVVFDLRLFAITFLIVCGFILIVSIFKTASLKRKGPHGIAVSLGGKLVQRGGGSARELRLYNVVEEIALAAGCPVPHVYVLDKESSINACAIGTSPENAAVCVTAGALDFLTRDELQGVVAHEFSHIVNNDVNLDTKLIGYLFGLEVIALIAAIVFRSTLEAPISIRSDRSSKDGSSSSGGVIIAILFISGALFLIGYIGTVFGNIIRAAISRQREFLADASAVQFTRNPEGIAGALKKIGSPGMGSHIANSASVQASHMFFGSVFQQGFLQSLFQTHPPLAKRILAIDPGFDGVFPKTVQKNRWPSSSDTTSEDSEASAQSSDAAAAGDDVASSQIASFADQTSLASGSQPSSPLGFSREELYGSAFGVMAGGAPPTDEFKVRVDDAVLETVPQEWDHFLVDSVAARAALYAVLRSSSADDAQKQRAIISQSESAELNQKLDSAWMRIETLGETSRLILARKAVPLLKTLSLEEYQTFRSITIELCQTDGVLDLFEYTLQALVIRELDLYYRLSREPKIRYSSLESVLSPFAHVLSHLAYEGALYPGDEIKAFQAGMSVVNVSANIVPKENCSLAAFSRALNVLSLSAPLVKQKILQALYRCIAIDGVVTEKEAATLSAVTAALGVPAPVWHDWR